MRTRISLPATWSNDDAIHAPRRAQAEDAEGNAFSFLLGEAPATLVLNGETGQMAFTPPAAGEYAVVLYVRDEHGAYSGIRFVIQALDPETATDTPPEVRGLPGAWAQVGKEYTFDVDAYDAEGDLITYELVSPPAGMEIDDQGVIRWTPTAAQAGAHRIAVRVFAGGKGVSFSYTLTARVNTTPVMQAIAEQTIYAGMAFSAEALVTDDDPAGALRFELIGAPEGMTIDRNGRIAWVTTQDDAEPEDVEGQGRAYTVTVRVTDPFGEYAETDFTLTVEKDTQAPVVVVTPSKLPALLDDTITFTVKATDNVGVVGKTLAIYSDAAHTQLVANISLNAQGRGSYTFNQAGTFYIRGTAWDAAGNSDVNHPVFPCDVIDVNDRQPPVVTFANLGENQVLSNSLDLVGSITDPDSTSVTWEVLLTNVETGQTWKLADGTTPVVDADWGTIDVASLRNGDYDVIVAAEDAGGNSTVFIMPITVSTQYKLGNFNLNFQDFSSSIGGLPVIIQRTYDTMNAGVKGEFGYGWSMSFIPVKLRCDAPSEAEDDWEWMENPNLAQVRRPAQVSRRGHGVRRRGRVLCRHGRFVHDGVRVGRRQRGDAHVRPARQY